jgi:hypothetical protein
MPAVAGLAFAVSFASWYVCHKERGGSLLCVQGLSNHSAHAAPLAFLGPRESGCYFSFLSCGPF